MAILGFINSTETFSYILVPISFMGLHWVTVSFILMEEEFKSSLDVAGSKSFAA